MLLISKEYNQKIGETYIQWRRRILSGIAANEIDMEWIDACILLGMPWDAERAKKLGESFFTEDKKVEETLDTQIEELKSNDPDWTAIDEKEAELRRMTIKYQDQRRMYQQLQRRHARIENLTESIKEAINDSDNKISFPTEYLHVEDNKDSTEGVLLLSDWHKGQTSANNWNVYNDAVFKERIAVLVADTINKAKTNNVDKLHVFVLGDLINGLIHVSTRISNEENVIKQTVQVAEILKKMLDEFSKHFDVYCYFSRGNHDRVHANMKESIDGESFFDLLMYIVEQAVDKSHPTLHIMHNDIDPEIIRAEVAGHICYGVHGHKDKPAKVAEKLPTFMHEIPDYIFEGHYHSAAEHEVNGIEIIVNSSLCGTDDFAVSLRRNSKPSQKLMIFDTVGRVCTYNIDVTRTNKLNK